MYFYDRCTFCVESRKKVGPVYQHFAHDMLSVTYVCLVPSSHVSRPGPNGNSPDSTLLTAPEALLEVASASSRIELDFSPPADFTSQHLTVESRLPETSIDDSAENESEVIWPW